jgi:hypothetical protein
MGPNFASFFLARESIMKMTINHQHVDTCMKGMMGDAYKPSPIYTNPGRYKVLLAVTQ